MAGFFYSLLVVGLPIGAIVFFIVSLVRFYSGKRNGCEASEMSKRKLLLVVSAVIAGTLIAALIGIMVLLATALAYM